MSPSDPMRSTPESQTTPTPKSRSTFRSPKFWLACGLWMCAVVLFIKWLPHHQASRSGVLSLNCHPHQSSQEIRLRAGDTTTLSVAFRTLAVDTYRCASYTDPVTFSSSNPSVVTVNTSGIVRAISTGSAVVSAKDVAGRRSPAALAVVVE